MLQTPSAHSLKLTIYNQGDTKMARYRKLPVEIEAYQITKEMVEAALFDGKPYPKGLRLSSAGTYPPTRRINAWHGIVTTIHGQETHVQIGDWIIAEPDGEHFYPCKSDIFAETYELVE
jgi:hypothetical protein